jgi:hypothetical protein
LKEVFETILHAHRSGALVGLALMVAQASALVRAGHAAAMKSAMMTSVLRMDACCAKY